MRRKPHRRLAAFVRDKKAKDPGFKQGDLITLLKEIDPSFEWSVSSLSRTLTGERVPNEHQRMVIERLTGIPAIDWASPQIRKLARDKRAA